MLETVSILLWGTIPTRCWVFPEDILLRRTFLIGCFCLNVLSLSERFSDVYVGCTRLWPTVILAPTEVTTGCSGVSLITGTSVEGLRLASIWATDKGTKSAR